MLIIKNNPRKRIKVRVRRFVLTFATNSIIRYSKLSTEDAIIIVKHRTKIPQSIKLY